jgi:hypothetical protein
MKITRSNYGIALKQSSQGLKSCPRSYIGLQTGCSPSGGRTARREGNLHEIRRRPRGLCRHPGQHHPVQPGSTPNTSTAPAPSTPQAASPPRSHPRSRQGQRGPAAKSHLFADVMEGSTLRRRADRQGPGGDVRRIIALAWPIVIEWIAGGDAAPTIQMHAPWVSCRRLDAGR